MFGDVLIAFGALFVFWGFLFTIGCFLLDCDVVDDVLRFVDGLVVREWSSGDVWRGVNSYKNLL